MSDELTPIEAGWGDKLRTSRVGPCLEADDLIALADTIAPSAFSGPLKMQMQHTLFCAVCRNRVLELKRSHRDAELLQDGGERPRDPRLDSPAIGPSGVSGSTPVSTSRQPAAPARFKSLPDLSGDVKTVPVPAESQSAAAPPKSTRFTAPPPPIPVVAARSTTCQTTPAPSNAAQPGIPMPAYPPTSPPASTAGAQPAMNKPRVPVGAYFGAFAVLLVIGFFGIQGLRSSQTAPAGVATTGRDGASPNSGNDMGALTGDKTHALPSIALSAPASASPDDGSVVLNWAETEGASSYSVIITEDASANGSSNNEMFRYEPSVVGTSCTVPHVQLTPGKTYKWTVEAKSGSTVIARSTSVFTSR